MEEQQVESNTDVFFLLDINQNCNSKTINCKKQALFVKELLKKLNLKRNSGSVSVLYNSKAIDDPNLVDDEMKKVLIPIQAAVYNSTSIECASCKTINHHIGKFCFKLIKFNLIN